MSIGGGGSSGNSQTQTQLDPQIKADWENLYNMTTGVAGQGVPQQSVAAFTPTEQAGLNYLSNNAGQGIGTIGNAISATQQATGYQAPSASAPSPGVISYSSVSQPTVSSSQLQQFINPYDQDVYNTSLAQLDQARRQAISQNGASATQQGGEGAWNGARAGVSDALTNQLFGQTAANLASTLNQTGFNTALSGLQTQQQMGEQAQAANQNASLSAGETAYGGDLSTALANQNAALQGHAQDLTADSLLGSLGSADQNAYLTAGNAMLGAGQQQQQQQQNILNTNYQNQMSTELLPIQTVESAFGIIPSTSSGGSSVTNSSGKSGNAGI